MTKDRSRFIVNDSYVNYLICRNPKCVGTCARIEYLEDDCMCLYSDMYEKSMRVYCVHDASKTMWVRARRSFELPNVLRLGNNWR